MLTISIKEQVTRALDTLSETELQQVAEYVTFLRFRMRVAPQQVIDLPQLTKLYAESAEEDRALAEEGMGEYHARLDAEDAHER